MNFVQDIERKLVEIFQWFKLVIQLDEGSDVVKTLMKLKL
jgi:hypothetical protein